MNDNVNDPLRYFGIELEVEVKGKRPANLVGDAWDCLGRDFVLLKHDGSLGEHGKGGFEIVSAPATKAYHYARGWTEFLEKYANVFHLNGPNSGMHVHIGKNTVLPMTAGKVLIFVNHKDNKNFISSIADRDLLKPHANGKYYAKLNEHHEAKELITQKKNHSPNCPWHPNNRASGGRYWLRTDGTQKTDRWGNPIIKSWENEVLTVRARCKCPDGRYNLDRYEALNVSTKRPTIEFRIFRSTMDKETFFANLEFCDAVINFADATRLKDMTYDKFLEWYDGQRSYYKNLTAMLIRRNWIEPRKPSELEMVQQQLGI